MQSQSSSKGTPDIERKRKSHGNQNKVLPSKPNAGPQKAQSYQIFKKESGDFLCLPQFHNNLPNVPSGPYFKRIELLHPYQDFLTYKMSTLEKSFIWQPQLGSDVGTKLDLVDQDAVLIPDKPTEDFLLDQLDIRYLTSGVVDTRRSKGRPLESTEKPWWLRNTTYLVNDLYRASKKLEPEVEDEGHQKRLKAEAPLFAQGSSTFNQVENSIYDLRERLRREDGVEVEWDIPILPHYSMDGQFAIIQYDEHPDQTLAALSGSESVGDLTSDSIILNIRPQVSKQHEANSTNFAVSLVGRAAPEEEERLSSESAVLYTYLRDYKMEVQPKEDDVFIITIVPSSETHGAASASASGSPVVTPGSARYIPIRSKMMMRKLAEGRPHEALVTRSS